MGETYRKVGKMESSFGWILLLMLISCSIMIEYIIGIVDLMNSTGKREWGGERVEERVEEKEWRRERAESGRNIS